MSCCSDKNAAAFADFFHNEAETLSGTGTTVYTIQKQNNDCICCENSCEETCESKPVPEVPLYTREYRLCIDQSGGMAQYPADCRNHFWPYFSHPRWLPCSCLYCSSNCCIKHHHC